MTIAAVNSIFFAIDTNAARARNTDGSPGLLHTVSKIIGGLADGLNASRTYEDLVAKGIGKAEAARIALGVVLDERR